MSCFPEKAYCSEELMRTLGELFEKYPFAEVSEIGKSVMNKSIPIIKIGRGDKKILYVGAHHGSEWITSALLMKFTAELCEKHRGEEQYSVYSQNICCRREAFT